jgi:curved DNA-binding protein CbpA
MRAQELLDTAWQVLGDPEGRKRYDEAVGFRRSGGGLGQPRTGIESAGMAPADLGIIGELPGVDAVGGLLGWTGWLAPRRARALGEMPATDTQEQRPASDERMSTGQCKRSGK